jgi:hypothetical protein
LRLQSPSFFQTSEWAFERGWADHREGQFKGHWPATTNL